MPPDVRTIAVDAYGLAATFKLKELLPVLSGDGVGRAIAKIEGGDRAISRRAPGQYVIAYDFGALVFFGIPKEEQKQIVDAVVHRVGKEPHAPFEEDFFVEERPGSDVEARFDRVVVSAFNEAVVEIVGLVLAQSVAMDYYAEDVEGIEAETERITSGLRERGQIPGRVRDLVKFIGQCIGTRNDVLSTLALFDKPDSTWESEQLDRLYNGLYRALDLDDRYRTMESKLRTIQDNLVLLADLARHRHTLFLEATVVVLILLEVVVMFWQLVATGGHS